MSKVHITLVGGQTTPVYQGIIYSNPDKVVFVYSNGSRENAERIKSEIKISTEMRKMDPVDLNNIEKNVKLCFERYRNDEISINISSGTKPWAYYFSNIFADHSNVMIFYIDQNGKLWNFADKTSTEVPFDMDAQFRLYGNELTQYTNFNEFSDQDKNVLSNISALQAFDSTTFFRLVAIFRDKSNELEQTIKNGSYLKWNKSEKSFDFKIIANGKSLQKTLQSKHVRDFLLKAGWFEYKIAAMLSTWDKAHEIRLNCKFPYQDTATKNEIDIIVDTGSKLLFVECKTQIDDNTDIDKFCSAVKNYGGSGSKALFITEMTMNNKAVEKCADNGISSFSLQDEHLNMTPEAALKMLLDSELFNINTK